MWPGVTLHYILQPDKPGSCTHLEPTCLSRVIPCCCLQQPQFRCFLCMQRSTTRQQTSKQPGSASHFEPKHCRSHALTNQHPSRRVLCLSMPAESRLLWKGLNYALEGSFIAAMTSGSRDSLCINCSEQPAMQLARRPVFNTNRTGSTFCSGKLPCLRTAQSMTHGQYSLIYK